MFGPERSRQECFKGTFRCFLERHFRGVRTPCPAAGIPGGRRMECSDGRFSRCNPDLESSRMSDLEYVVWKSSAASYKTQRCRCH